MQISLQFDEYFLIWDFHQNLLGHPVSYVVACKLYNGSETNSELKTDRNMTIRIGINWIKPAKLLGWNRKKNTLGFNSLLKSRFTYISYLSGCMMMFILLSMEVSLKMCWGPATMYINWLTRETWKIPSKSEKKFSILKHTVRNLHFLSKNSTLITRENCRFFWGEKLVKMLWFWSF